MVSEITEELSMTRLNVKAIITTLTRSLSRRRPGMWMATLLNTDPSTSMVIVADDSNHSNADYISTYLAHLDRLGRVPNTGLAREVIDSGRPALFPRMAWSEFVQYFTSHGQNYYAEHPMPVAFDSVGMLLVPMHAREATIGTLGVVDWNSRQRLDEDDVKWVQLLADRAGNLLEYALFHDAAIDRLERLIALRNVALAITSSDDLRLTLEVILEQVTSKLKLHAAGFLLPDESGLELVSAAYTGFHSASIPSYRFPLDPELRDPALIRRTPLVRELDRIDHGQRRSLFAREGFQLYIGMPLISGNKFRGVLEVFHRSPLEPDQEWFGFLEAMGSNAAIAIERSTTQETLERSGHVPSRPTAPVPEFSRLERWILGLVVDGATNQEIAETVHLSQNTVKFHVRRILQKAGTVNRTELARKATQQGWL
jgi:DNA-binding CsgD family transcriptional regulator/GAF domain-containing protein